MSESPLHNADYAQHGADPATSASWDAVTHDPHVQTPQAHPAAEGLSYEQARDQLVEIVRQLETGQGGLEESLKLWEKGEALAAHCQAWLDGAQSRLDRAMAARNDASQQQ
ncbi:exodeoxyribonuclease VII small subunit [Micrococcales bacterium 31B]|nr:exodeoxyribonuclease VII small subunit [Micrococcales bacterium 31B]